MEETLIMKCGQLSFPEEKQKHFRVNAIDSWPQDFWRDNILGPEFFNVAFFSTQDVFISNKITS